MKELKFSSLHFIPRGSVLFHVESITCLVLYVGKESKIGQLVSSPNQVRSRTISDKALDRCIMMMIYLIIGFTVLFSIMIAAERSANLVHFEEEVVGTAGFTFWEILIMTFLELEFCIPVSLLFIIELLRIWLARNISIALVNQDGRRAFASPSHTDDLGKVSHVIFDGMKFLTKTDLVVKSISTVKGRYKNNSRDLMGKLENNGEEGKALTALAEAVLLSTLSVQSSSENCVRMNTEDKALSEFANSIGVFVNRVDKNLYKIGDALYEYIDSFSVPINNDLLCGSVIRSKQSAKIKYVLKGCKEQMADYINSGIADFTPRGLKTIFFVTGYLDAHESCSLEDATHNELMRKSIYERNLSLYESRPCNLKTIGSIGFRNKANADCSILFDQFKAAGIQVLIASQNSIEAVKAYCIESNILSHDNFELINTQSILENTLKGKNKPVNLFIDGCLLKHDRSLNIVASLFYHFNEKIVISNMTSELKKSLVQRVLMQRSENNEDAFQRVLSVMNPVKLETQAIIAVGSSAHDVEMMKSADFAIYLDPDTSNFNFKE